MDLSQLTLDTPIKFLRKDGSATHSGRRSYAKNRWLPAIKGPLVMCANGYHITTPRHWQPWGEAQLWLVETRGEGIHEHDGTKSCYSSIKLTQQLDTWSPKSQRLLACQIAESVLHLTPSLEARTAIEVARQHAHGRVTDEELQAASEAASEAASRAAWAASEAASRAASRAAQLQHAEWFLATIKGEINQ